MRSRRVFSGRSRDRGRLTRRIVTWTIVLGALAAWVLTAGLWLDHPVKPKHPDAIFLLSDFGERKGASEAAALLRGAGAKRLIVFVSSSRASTRRKTVGAV